MNVADGVDVCMQLNTGDPLRLGPTQAVEMGNIGAPELPKHCQTITKFAGFFFSLQMLQSGSFLLF